MERQPQKPKRRSSRRDAQPLKPMRRTLRYSLYPFVAMLFAAAGATVVAQDWRSSSREPLAPDPAVVKEAMVQVYGARAVGAKGLFGVHTWVAVKATDAP